MNPRRVRDVGPGDRLKQLRTALHLTQSGLADASQKHEPDAKLTRVDVVSVEIGRNKATSNRIHKGIAAAVGASVEDTSAYLDGRLPIGDLLRRIDERRTESHRRVAGVPLRFCDRPEWERVVGEAKARSPSIPARFFEEVGAITDHLTGPLDAFFVGDFARMLFDHANRNPFT